MIRPLPPQFELASSAKRRRTQPPERPVCNVPKRSLSSLSGADFYVGHSAALPMRPPACAVVQAPGPMPPAPQMLLSSAYAPIAPYHGCEQAAILHPQQRPNARFYPPRLSEPPPYQKRTWSMFLCEVALAAWGLVGSLFDWTPLRFQFGFGMNSFRSPMAPGRSM